MSLETRVFILISIFALITVFVCPSVRAKTCVKTSICSCKFDDGSGIVNISDTGRRDGTPLIHDVLSGSDYLYSFNPCYPFNEGTCHNASGCQKYRNGDVYYDIGDYSIVDFSFDGTNVVGTYSAAVGGRMSIVTYVCDPGLDPPQTLVSGEIAPSKYGFRIVSKHACPIVPSTPTPSPKPTPTPADVPPVIVLTNVTISSGHLAHPDLGCLIHARGVVQSTQKGTAVGAKQVVFVCIKDLI